MDWAIRALLEYGSELLGHWFPFAIALFVLSWRVKSEMATVSRNAENAIHNAITKCPPLRVAIVPLTPRADPVNGAVPVGSNRTPVT